MTETAIAEPPARELIEAVPCKMPAPLQMKMPLKQLNYLIVLIREGTKVSACIGASTDPDWVAQVGARIPLQLARVYFPDLDNSLDRGGCEYVGP